MTLKDLDFEVEKRGFRARVSWPWLMGAFVAFFGMLHCIFWLYSDTHNDSRYLSVKAYTVDQANLTRQIDAMGDNLTRQLTSINQVQDMILNHVLQVERK